MKIIRKLNGVCSVCDKTYQYYRTRSSGLYCSKKCAYVSPAWLEKQRLAKTKTCNGIPDKEIKARIRVSKEYKEWRLMVFKRDNYRCVNCGSKKNIQSHHTIPFTVIFGEVKMSNFDNLAPLYDLDNGQTLCENCHKNTDTYFRGEVNVPETKLIKVLSKCFEQDAQGYTDFELYYKFKMEEIINHFKGKLNESNVKILLKKV